MTQNLSSKSNQDKLSKSKSASLSAETVVHDKNTKEHLKNKVNQKDLPQLIKKNSATSRKLKNSAQKVLGKQKKPKSVKTKVISFIPRQDLHPSDICLYRNKALSDISDAESYALITDAYKPPKNFDFPESERSFRLIWFEEFTWVFYSQWRIAPIVFLLFYLVIKLWEVLVSKIFTENHIENGQQQ